MRQHFFCGLVQDGQRFALAHAGARGKRDGDRIELLEALERLRLRAFLQRDDGGQRNECPIAGAGVIVFKIAGIEAVLALHLRDHPVRAVFHREQIAVATGQHRRHVGGQRAHVYPQHRRFVAVDVDLDARLVDLQILVEEDEALAGIRLGQNGVRQLRQLLQVAHAANDEFTTAAAATGAG